MTGVPDRQETLTPSELQEIVRIFADSDLQELRLSVDGVDLLLSRNEYVGVSDAAGGRASPAVESAAAPDSPVRAVGSSPAAEARVAEPITGSADPTNDLHAGGTEVRSPSVGTFYRRPAPDKAPFVEVGSQVSAGDPVGAIEVMKMFTTVTAETDGTVTEICVGDASLVEHGQVLMYLEAAST
ncbi:MAG: acetyl-CoA carboxylase [Nocardioidaceae bacterium]